MAIKVGISTVSAALRKLLAEITAYINRVVSDGGTVVSESSLRSQVKRSVIALNPSLYTIPNGRKASKLYSVLPDTGAGDFTVTRAGTTAMELNADGFWQQVAANLPRYDYVSGRPMLNVEELRTNLLPSYKSFAHSDWTKSGARIEGDPTTAGAELVINGGFDTDTAWVKGTGWTISGGKANANSATSYFRQNDVGVTLGSNVFVSVVVTITSGSITYICGNGGTQTLLTNGVNAFYTLFNGLTDDIVFYGNNFTGTIDNVSVKEVTGYASPFVDANGANLMDGYKLVAVSNNGYIRLATAVTVTAATTYSNSIWIKRVTGTGQAYIIDTNTTDRAITLTTEWQRFTYSAAAGSTSGQIGVKLAVAGDEVLIAHAQLEAGATASSPIGGAEGSSQTRNADVIIKTGASALIGQTEGVIYVSTNFKAISQTRPILALSNEASEIGIPHRIALFFTSENKLVAYFADNTSSDSLVGAVITDGIKKIAFRYNLTLNTYAVYVNGVEYLSGAISKKPTQTLNKISIGSRTLNNTNSYLNGQISIASIFKTELSNAQLQALTTL